MEETQSQEPEAPGKFKSFVNECIRVLRVTKKPSREEFKTIVKVSGLGMTLIGFIGFVVTMIKQVFLK